MCEIHCYFCPHILWVYYFDLSQCDEVLSLHAVCILQMPETALLQEGKKKSGQTCELTTFLNSVYCFFCSFPLICFSIDLFVDFFSFLNCLSYNLHHFYLTLGASFIGLNELGRVRCGVKLSRLVSIFTSKNVWKFLIKIQLTMPIRVK